MMVKLFLIWSLYVNEALYNADQEYYKRILFEEKMQKIRNQWPDLQGGPPSKTTAFL